MPGKGEGVTRKAALGDWVAMPECSAVHLVAYLWEIGPSMGEHPLTHGEIEAWQRNTGMRLDSWEARILRRLSAEYLDESSRATNPDRLAPWRDAPYAMTAAQIASERMRAETRKLSQL